MAETGLYLQRELPRLETSIVLTRAMTQLGFEGGDGLRNITESLMAVQPVRPGVYVLNAQSRVSCLSRSQEWHSRSVCVRRSSVSERLTRASSVIFRVPSYGSWSDKGSQGSARRPSERTISHCQIAHLPGVSYLQDELMLGVSQPSGSDCPNNWQPIVFVKVTGGLRESLIPP